MENDSTIHSDETKSNNENNLVEVPLPPSTPEANENQRSNDTQIEEKVDTEGKVYTDIIDSVENQKEAENEGQATKPKSNSLKRFLDSVSFKKGGSSNNATAVDPSPSPPSSAPTIPAFSSRISSMTKTKSTTSTQIARHLHIRTTKKFNSEVKIQSDKSKQGQESSATSSESRTTLLRNYISTYWNTVFKKSKANSASGKTEAPSAASPSGESIEPSQPQTIQNDALEKSVPSTELHLQEVIDRLESVNTNENDVSTNINEEPVIEVK